MLCASIFHYGSTRWARRRSACGRRGSRCGCDVDCATARAHPAPARHGAAAARARGLPPAYLVGGAVRDLLRGAAAVDLDLAVEGDARSVARALAERLGGRHASTSASAPRRCAPGDLSFDLATTRTESYAEPGALPTVAPATLAEDLRRRDFTDQRDGGRAGRRRSGPPLRPPRRRAPTSRPAWCASSTPARFLDDPTRLLRAVRYETRLGFRMDQATERAAATAVAEGAHVDGLGRRVRDELMDLLAEHEAPAGAWSACATSGSIARSTRRSSRTRSWSRRPRSARRRSAPTVRWRRWPRCARRARGLDAWLDGPAARRRASATRWRARPRGAGPGARAARARATPSELHALLGGEPPEALALALALGAPSRADPAVGHRPEPRAARDRRRRPDRGRRPGGPGDRAGARARRCGASSTALVHGRDEELRTALELAGDRHASSCPARGPSSRPARAA